MAILFNEFFWCFKCLIIFFPLGFEGYFVFEFALDGGLVFLSFAHDIGEDVLFSEL